jgi:hypothetical protein
MMKMCVGVVGLFLVGVCGCEAPGPDPVAQSKCADVVAAVCARVAICDPSTDPSTTTSACVSMIAANLDCGRASGVSSSFDSCESALQVFDCTVLDGGSTLPKSCDGVIQITK